MLPPQTPVWHAGWRTPAALGDLLAGPPRRCAACATPLAPEHAACPACGAPADPGAARAGAAWPTRAPDTLGGLLADYLSPARFSELLASPRFWLLYSLAAFPLLVLAFAPRGTASWMFVYFSLVWAFLFFRLVQPEPGTARLAVRVYLLTGLVAMPLLLLWLSTPPFVTEALLEAGGLARALGFLLGVGPREEAAKLVPLALVILWRRGGGGRPLSLRQGLVLGAVAGFAFAAVENVEYLRMFEAYDRQAVRWGVFSRTSLDASLARMLLTPFMHGAWAGIAGYFWAWGEWNRPVRWRLRLAGLVGAALLHGLYDTVAEVPLLALAAVAFTFHVLVRCVSRAANEEGPEAALERPLG
jgi:RsiW-degrading membrane proteinase PrsW (M82 family)